MPQADSTLHTATPAMADTAQPNVFSQMFGFLGNHHAVDINPFGEIPLPYIFFDQGKLHVYGNSESLQESGVYTTNTDKRFDTLGTIQASPLAEKGSVVRLDHKPIGLDLSITSNLFFLAFAAVVLFIVLRIAASKAKKSLVPSGLRNAIEVLIVFVREDIVAPNVAAPYDEALMPFFLTVFFFIWIVNLTGLIPWAHTATSSIEITAALAICTFVITQFVGLREMGIKTYLKHLTAGLLEMELSPVMKGFLLLIMVPIELMGLFTKPFALAIRLFANMTAGHIVILSLIGLIFLFHSVLVGAFVTVPFGVFVYLLEIFVATLQAYIFTVLSAVFIGMMAHTEHDEHVQDHDLPHAPNGDHLVATAHG